MDLVHLEQTMSALTQNLLHIERAFLRGHEVQPFGDFDQASKQVRILPEGRG